MKDFFFLKVLAKNTGVHYTWERIICGKMQYTVCPKYKFLSGSLLFKYTKVTKLYTVKR